MSKDKNPVGSSVEYYKVKVKFPTTEGILPYQAECNDIIEALDMKYGEANIFKAIWRKAAGRLGNGKPGSKALYEAEKIAFFANRILYLERTNHGTPVEPDLDVPKPASSFVSEVWDTIYDPKPNSYDPNKIY